MPMATAMNPSPSKSSDREHRAEACSCSPGAPSDWSSSVRTNHPARDNPLSHPRGRASRHIPATTRTTLRPDPLAHATFCRRVCSRLLRFSRRPMAFSTSDESYQGCEGGEAIVKPHPHELGPLLLALGRAGIELAPHPTDPTRLRHRPAVLPSDLVARVRVYKPELLAMLVMGCASSGDDARYVSAERLGIADDLQKPTNIGSPAWLIAVGESLDLCCDIATRGVYSANGTTDGRDHGGYSRERGDP